VVRTEELDPYRVVEYLLLWFRSRTQELEDSFEGDHEAVRCGGLGRAEEDRFGCEDEGNGKGVVGLEEEDGGEEGSR
jgi:hypothetical protein